MAEHNPYMPPIGGGKHHYVFPSDLEDTDCVDGDGEVWPEHVYPPVGEGNECRRCGAEVADEEG